MEVDIQGDKMRKSLRLRGYDYANEGAYFVTLVAKEYKCIFGSVVSGEVFLSDCGQIAHDEWLCSPKVRPEIGLHEDEFVVMPNHIHGIVWIVGPDVNGQSKSNQVDVRATGRLPIPHVDDNRWGPKPKSLSAFVAGYKSSVTKRINLLRGTPRSKVWMQNFHDRVIRNESELSAIREYIQNNPLKWELDSNYIK